MPITFLPICEIDETIQKKLVFPALPKEIHGFSQNNNIYF